MFDKKSRKETWKGGGYRYRRKKRFFTNFQGYWSNEFRKNQEPDDEWSDMKRFVYNNTIVPAVTTTTKTTTTTITTTTTKRKSFYSPKSRRRKKKRKKVTQLPKILPPRQPQRHPQQLQPQPQSPSKQIGFEMSNLCMVQDYLSKPSSEPTRCLFELKRIPIPNKNGGNIYLSLVPEEIFEACRQLDKTFEVNYCKLKDDDKDCLLMEVRGNNIRKFYNMAHLIENQFFVEIKKTQKIVSDSLYFLSIMLFPKRRLRKIIDSSGLTEDEINLEINSKAGLVKKQLELEISVFNFDDTKTYFEYKELKSFEFAEKKRWLTLYFSCVVDLIAAQKELLEKHKDYPNIGLFDL
jgi:hypothetical protein